MKINVTKHELLSRLRVIGKVVKLNHHEVAYSSFLIETLSEKQISITGCDESGRIETTIGCSIEDFKEMKFLVDAKTLMDGLKELPDQPITIEVNDAKLVVKYHTGKYELPTGDASIYPEPYSSENKTEFEINHALLVKGFKSTMKFVAEDDLRPIMGNINMQCKGNDLSFAGSNGHVLAIYEVADESLGLPDFKVNIPDKAVKVVANIAQPNKDIKIPISYNHNNITFIVEGYKITYRLFEGRYPNIWSVIPKDTSIRVEVNRADLIAAISRVSVFANEASSMIVFTTKENTLILKSEDIDFSKGATEILMLNEIHDDFTIGFKSNYLNEILKTIDEETCEVNLSTPGRAALIKPKGSSDATFILMPMQVNY